MARTPKDYSNNIQVFAGSKPQLGPYEKHAGIGCCANNTVQYDKLGDVVRFDNSLAHLNPTGGNEKFSFPYGNPGGAFENNYNAIIEHINAVGQGATVSIIAIPNYAFIKGIAVHISSEVNGLTFNLKTRNGLTLPTVVKKVETATGTACAMTRTVTDTDETAYEGFGDMDNNYYVDLIGYSGDGIFTAEADEIMLEVATMPASNKVSTLPRIDVAVSYDVVSRAERA